MVTVETGSYLFGLGFFLWMQPCLVHYVLDQSRIALPLLVDREADGYHRQTLRLAMDKWWIRAVRA